MTLLEDQAAGSSSGAKRAVELGAFVIDEVVEDVGRAQWVFTVPRMLRIYFLHRFWARSRFVEAKGLLRPQPCLCPPDKPPRAGEGELWAREAGKGLDLQLVA
jgi:hypothetical protein